MEIYRNSSCLGGWKSSKGIDWHLEEYLGIFGRPWDLEEYLVSGRLGQHYRHTLESEYCGVCRNIMESIRILGNWEAGKAHLGIGISSDS